MNLSELISDVSALKRLFTGGRWLEGPCWLPTAGRLRFSDVIGNRVWDLDPLSGQATVHDDAPDHVNGRTIDLDGSVIQCSHGGRRLERDRDGHVSVIVDRWHQARFNAPNDVVVSSDGSIWFTDPAYGIIYPEEGHPGRREYCDHWVFRLTPQGRLTVALTDLVEPNGLAFSPDETILYVADSAALNREGAMERHHIRRYLVDDWRVKAGQDFVEVRPGVPDGIKVDEHGNVWSSCLSGVVVYSPDGQEIGRIPVPEKVGNLCFGGEDGSDLFVAASTSIYTIPTLTRDCRHLSGRA
ncbi:SMP-30/gluconolactonase/LRE family protein [Schaalia sp. 19OD2882]|uniref:SMP-30/gluconolactonase/LRE family protein n=1 Tax=Schaalia sp. 19OD2882 TaxID=2794089 RepID=UPI001C1F1550|nr:SMP-30/gluconolactonase/LRE family protein [Schaalia sp. 19OD2882]QWW20086.1 SMP-30/gluconolactonase/LRE family protein [Schaalia sp. 19OD2882]